MTYLEFKQAAKKHYFTCKCLYKKCKDNWHIQENIFYLCGYVIEMMLKYQIFRSINYDRNADIRQLNYNNLKFDNIKTHNIITLLNILKKFEERLIFNEIITTFKNWNIEIRYNGKRKDYENIKNVLELCEKIIENFER